jgi:hypothetical protein
VSKTSRRERAAQKNAAAAEAAAAEAAAAAAAAERTALLAQISPLARSATERLGPLAHNAADRVGPLAHLAVDRLGPLASEAVDRVSPYTHSAAERIVPIAASAKLLGSQAAHDAVDKLGPALHSARERVGPAVDVARDKVSDDLLPRLSEALTAAAASPIAVEAAKRGQATLAAAKGELSLPEPKKKGRWIKRLALIAAVTAVAVVAFRKFFGTKDADWQAARPSTPYAPPTPPAPPTPAPADVPIVEVPEATDSESSVDVDAAAGDDPQAGETAHDESLEANGEPVPDQPAEGGEAMSEAVKSADVPIVTIPASVELGEPPAEAYEQQPTETNEYQEPADGGYAEPGGGAEYDRPADDEGGLSEAAEPRWSGEGVYVGNEPPEGYVIKGNSRSMKYHLPEALGYARTTAEVWFNSEEAAQRAGFIRAQR